MRINHAACLAAFSLLLLSPTSLRGQDTVAEEEDVLAGHSFHGEAFNEGPRQAAYLMRGISGISFPATTQNELAQKFINQGVAQLHGFWYYEAERSFRQASMLDPECAICYWGMAQANWENRKRGRDFIAQAVELKDGASRREQLYIDSTSNYFRDEDDKGKKIEKKDQAQKYTRDLEEIVGEFPDDIEARALLGLQLYHNARAGLPIVSYVAVDSVLQDVFDANPMHPAHHYRIHLWDRQKAENALASAADCGPSLPAIAHMWHMPGHIYSRLHRYADAAWQQEASARVDHAHMMRDRVMPDQIHNFAHNNEWLIRNLLKLGRVSDALSLAKNMLELPRHPKYNSLSKGSAKYGRDRLLLTLTTYRLWDQLIEAAHSDYLEKTPKKEQQIERLQWLAASYALTNQSDNADLVADDLRTRLAHVTDRLDQLKADRDAAKQAAPDKSEATKEPAKENASADDKTAAAADASQEDSKKAAANRARQAKQRDDEIKELEADKKLLDKAVATYRVASAAAAGKWEKALDGWKASAFKDEGLHAEWLAASGKLEEAMKAIDKQVDASPGEVLPLAVKAWIQTTYGSVQEAGETLRSLQVVASEADLDTPLLARLTPLAVEAGLGEAWAVAAPPADDIGQRPELDSLGPFRWRPYIAPDFTVETGEGLALSRADVIGKPTLVIFYLGFGCLHCIEQLHEFSPRIEEFREAGVEILAISSETKESLTSGLESYGKPLEVPLHADPEMTAFRSFRCYDDFEEQPLHGTFLIDSDGMVLWQDISYEPFMDVDFALQESQRLLKLHNQSEASASESSAPPEASQSLTQ